MSAEFIPGNNTDMRVFDESVFKISNNHPSKHERLTLAHQAVLLAHRLQVGDSQLLSNQVPAELPKIHAKVLSTEKTTIIGSHNFVGLGVLLGTPELALIRHDRSFSEATSKLLLSQVQRSI